MPDDIRRRIGETLEAHVPSRLSGETLDARAAVALVLRPPVDTSPEATGAGADITEGLAAELLFVRRAVFERDPWSGDMALPGGRRDPTDASLVETALRELREETALELAPIDVIGRLDETAPGNPALPAIGITPFVLWHDTGEEVRPSAEVTDHVWVPLPVLLDEGHRSALELQHQGRTRVFPTVEFRGYTIWGLTLRIVTGFLTLVDSSREF